MGDKTVLLQAIIGGPGYPPIPHEELVRGARIRAEKYHLSPEEFDCMLQAGMAPHLENPTRPVEVKMPALWTLPQKPVTELTPLIRPEGNEQDGERFWNLLVALTPYFREFFRQRGGRHPLTPPTEILDVACGGARDAVPLHSYFGGVPYGVPGENVNYVGVDLPEGEWSEGWLDSSPIDAARERHKDRPDLRFEKVDATDLDVKPFLRKKFDFVVIRHPEVFPKHGYRWVQPVWFKIFKESLEHVVPGGLVLVTNYYKYELNGSRKTMECLGAEEVFVGKNPFGSVNSVYAVRVPRDGFVALYRRKFP